MIPPGAPIDPAHARARATAEHYAPAEPRALGALAILAAAAILWVVLPVGIGVLAGTLLAFTMQPTNRALARRTQRPTLVAFALTTAATVAVTAILGALLYILVVQGLSVVSHLPEALAGGGQADALIEKLVAPLAPLHVDAHGVIAQIQGAAGSLAASLAGWAAKTALLVFDGLLALLFMAVTLYVVLRHWRPLALRAERLMPINPHHTRRILREVQRLGRTVVVGNFGTAFVQGLLAGVGFWLGHVPQPAFLGLLTGLISLVPTFGTPLVWGPIGIGLLATGQAGAGAFELLWGAIVVVGLCDYVVRPRLVGRGDGLSSWMTLVALFGGIKLFGIAGLFVGPVLVGVAMAILRVYERTRRFRLGLG